jgi:hypothetical protein
LFCLSQEKPRSEEPERATKLSSEEGIRTRKEGRKEGRKEERKEGEKE